MTGHADDLAVEEGPAGVAELVALKGPADGMGLGIGADAVVAIEADLLGLGEFQGLRLVILHDVAGVAGVGPPVRVDSLAGRGLLGDGREDADEGQRGQERAADDQSYRM